MRVTTMLFGLILLLALVAGSNATVSAAPSLQDGCPGNMLANPGFEGGSRKTDHLGTSLSSAVADDWIPWFIRGSESENREPEFKVEQTAIGGDPFRVRSGANAMKWFTTWATHNAGVYQQVPVRPGVPVTFSAHGMIYTGEGDGWSDSDKTFYSDPVKPGEYKIWVGIDPTGAVPAEMGAGAPASVVWSEPSMTMDEYVPLSVSVAPQASTITVYVKGAPHWSVKHNDSFWDDTCLRTGGSPVAAAQPVSAPAEAPPAAPPVEEAVEAEAPAEAPAPVQPAAPQAESADAPAPTGRIVPLRRPDAPQPYPVPPVLGEQYAIPW